MLTELKNRIARANTLQPEQGPHHAELSRFVGKWKVEGKNSETSPAEASQMVSGEESWEWLDGEFFLVNKFDRTMGETRFTGLGWIGFDEAADAYLSHSISSTGFLRVYHVEISHHEMKFEGETERAVVTLSADGAKLVIKWEHREAALAAWQPLCDLEGHRLN